MASDLESSKDWRLEIPATKSWYVAFGWTVARNALGSKDLEVIKTEASAIKATDENHIFSIFIGTTDWTPYSCSGN